MTKFEVHLRQHGLKGMATNVTIQVEADYFALEPTRSVTSDGHTLVFCVRTGPSLPDRKIAAFSYWNTVLEVQEWTHPGKRIHVEEPDKLDVT